MVAGTAATAMGIEVGAAGMGVAEADATGAVDTSGAGLKLNVRSFRYSPYDGYRASFISADNGAGGGGMTGVEC